MDKIKMNSELLNLIIMVHDYYKLMRSESIFYNESAKRDTYKQTQDYYNKIDKSILSKYNLEKNNCSFEKIMHYSVTNEVLSTLSENLGQFEF